MHTGTGTNRETGLVHACAFESRLDTVSAPPLFPSPVQITREDLGVACSMCPGLTALSLLCLRPEAPQNAPEWDALPVLRVLPYLRALTLRLDTDAHYLPYLSAVSLLTRLTSLDVAFLVLEREQEGRNVVALQAAVAAAATLPGLESLRLHASGEALRRDYEGWSTTLLAPLSALTRLQRFSFCLGVPEALTWPSQVTELELRGFSADASASELFLSMPRLRRLSLLSVSVADTPETSAATNEHLNLWVLRLGLVSACHLRPHVGVLRCQHLVCDPPAGQDAARQDLELRLVSIRMQISRHQAADMGSQSLAQLKAEAAQRRQRFEAQERDLLRTIGEIERLWVRHEEQFAEQLEADLWHLTSVSVGRAPLGVETVHLGWDALPDRPTPSVTEALVRAWQQLPTRAPAPDLVLWQMQVSNAEVDVIRDHGGFSGLSFAECGGGRGGARDPDAYNGGFTFRNVNEGG